MKIIGSLERWLILAAVITILFAFMFINIQFLDGEFKLWIQPTPIMSLIGLIVGFLLVSWQLEKQYHNVIEANRKQAQDRLKVEIYEEIVARIEAAGPHLAQLLVLPSIFLIELKHRMARVSPGESNYSFNRAVSSSKCNG